MNVETVAIVGGMLFTCAEAIEGAAHHTPMERRGAYRRLLSGATWMIPVAIVVYAVAHLLVTR